MPMLTDFRESLPTDRMTVRVSSTWPYQCWPTYYDVPMTITYYPDGEFLMLDIHEDEITCPFEPDAGFSNLLNMPRGALSMLLSQAMYQARMDHW